MKKGDIVIILLVISLSLVLVSINFMNNRSSNHNLKAIIYYNGHIYKEVKLSEEQEFEVITDIGRNLVKVHDNGIEIIEADCETQVCVETKIANKNGQMIVCLPNKIVIKVIGGEEDELDGISG